MACNELLFISLTFPPLPKNNNFLKFNPPAVLNTTSLKCCANSAHLWTILISWAVNGAQPLLCFILFNKQTLQSELRPACLTDLSVPAAPSPSSSHWPSRRTNQRPPRLGENTAADTCSGLYTRKGKACCWKSNAAKRTHRFSLSVGLKRPGSVGSLRNCFLCSSTEEWTHVPARSHATPPRAHCIWQQARVTVSSLQVIDAFVQTVPALIVWRSVWTTDTQISMVALLYNTSHAQSVACWHSDYSFGCKHFLHFLLLLLIFRIKLATCMLVLFCSLQWLFLDLILCRHISSVPRRHFSFYSSVQNFFTYAVTICSQIT